MTSQNNYELRSSRLDEEIKSLQKLIATGPEGSLISRKSGDNHYHYYQKIHNKEGKTEEFYISKDNRKLAQDLAAKEYCIARLKDTTAEKWIVDLILSNLKKEKRTDIYLRKHPGAAELILPVLRSDDDFARKWQEEEYTRSNLHPEHLIYPTIVPGLYVRSKSEAIIVAHLIKHHVPFRYEELVVIDGVALHPDFTCLNVYTREIFYIEHQGKWDDPKYVADVRHREDLYLKAGIIPWKNLLITTETKDQPFDMNWFDKIIEHYLLSPR